jgi:hypothetical protein
MAAADAEFTQVSPDEVTFIETIGCVLRIYWLLVPAVTASAYAFFVVLASPRSPKSRSTTCFRSFCQIFVHIRTSAGRFGSVHKASWRGNIVAVKRTLCLAEEAKLLAALRSFAILPAFLIMSHILVISWVALDCSFGLMFHRHRNIITFFGAHTTAPNFFLVIEYAEKGSLFSYLEMFTLDYLRVLQWSQHIAAAIRYLHFEAPQKIVHRYSFIILAYAVGSVKNMFSVCDEGL